ncbi:MAG: tetratricopeptide repeat protein, partial [Verrucomicrobiota bacterium]|nr:tetratricopeptide repeat protein [Verrucomicrobiota bacterium]
MLDRLRCVVPALLAAALAVSVGSGCSKQARKARYAERAEKYYEAGDYNRAEIEYKRVLRLEPGNFKAVYRLGSIYESQGRLVRAAAFLFGARSMDTNNLDVRVKCGYILSASGKAKEARDEATFVLDRNPAHPEAPLLLVDTIRDRNEIPAIRGMLERYPQRGGETVAYHLALGNLAMREGDSANAETAFKRALAMDPKSGAANFALGSMYLVKGDLKQAEAYYKAGADLESVRSNRRLRYADFKLQTGAVAEAKKLLEETVEKAPDYLPAYKRLAQIALGERKFDDCAAALRKVLIREDSDFDALMLRGRMRLLQQQSAEAVKEFTQLASKYPRVPSVHYNLAIAHLLNRDLAKAIASLNEAVRLEPDYTDAAMLLSELNLRKGDASAAIASLRQLLQRQSNNVPAHLLMANAYLARQMPDEALGVYRRLASMMPTNPQPPFLMGRVLRSQGKTQEARQAFEKAASFAPDDLVLLEQLVDLDLSERKYDSALKRVTEAINKDPKAAGPQLILAVVHLAQGMTNQAESVLRKVIELDTNARPAHLMLAQIALQSNRRDQALQQLETLLAKNPKDVTALLQVAAIHESSGDYRAAASWYEKVLAVSTNSPVAMNNLAYLYSERLGQLDKAQELAQRARDLRPNDPSVADTLGWILFKRGDYGKALELIKESAEKLSSEPEIQYHLGAVHYCLGEEDMARLALQLAVESKREFRGKDEANRMLSIVTIDTTTAKDQAISILEKALATHPGDVIAAIRLAAIHEQRGALDKAAAVYKQALNASPNSAALTVKLAELYAGRIHDLKQALEYARAAWKLAPEDPYIAQSLGRIALEAGDIEWALKLLQTSARLRPNQAEVLYDLAWAYYDTGDVGQAEANLKIALQADSQFSRAASARQLLSMIEVVNDPGKAEQAAAEIDKALKADPNSVPGLMAAAAVHEHRGNRAGAIAALEAVLRLKPAFKPAVRKLALLYAENPPDASKAYDLATKAREAYPQDATVAKALAVLAYQRGEYAKSAQLLKESARKLTADADV